MKLTVKGSSIRGTYVRLGYVKVPRMEKAFDSRNLLPSTALDPKLNFLALNFFPMDFWEKIYFNDDSGIYNKKEVARAAGHYMIEYQICQYCKYFFKKFPISEDFEKLFRRFFCNYYSPFENLLFVYFYFCVLLFHYISFLYHTNYNYKI